jgi:hypothetical protein
VELRNSPVIPEFPQYFVREYNSALPIVQTLLHIPYFMGICRLDDPNQFRMGSEGE